MKWNCPSCSWFPIQIVYFTSLHFVCSSLLLPHIFTHFIGAFFCCCCTKSVTQKPTHSRRTLTSLHKGPCAVIKQMTLNNLPVNAVPQKTITSQLKPNVRTGERDRGELMQENETKKRRRSKENTKWEEKDLREEVLQGSIYTYPSGAGAAGDTGVSSPGLGHSCLSSYSIRQRLKWIRSFQALCEFIRSCSRSRCTDR